MFTKIIDYLSKNFGKIKTIVAIVLAGLFIIFLIMNSCSKKQNEQLIEKITGLNIQNDLLLKDNKQKDLQLLTEKKQREELEIQYQYKQQEAQRLIIENSKLRKKITDIPDWLLTIPADSSYAFLNTIAYPYTGEQKYPFNEPQVKGIHQDYLENSLLAQLVDTLSAQMDICQEQLVLGDSMFNSFEQSLALYAQKENGHKQIISNYAVKSNLQDKEIKKLKRQKFFYKATTVLGAAVALIIAI